MIPTEHGEAVTSNRDTLAAAVAALLGADDATKYYDVPSEPRRAGQRYADALMPAVEAMLAQARAEVVAAVEATAWVTQDICNCDSERGRFGAHRDACPVMVLRAVLPALAAVSGTDHDTTLDTVRAEALRDAADKWQWGEWANAPRLPDRVQERIANGQYVGDWLRARADRIAPDDTPSEPGGDDAA